MATLLWSIIACDHRVDVAGVFRAEGGQGGSEPATPAEVAEPSPSEGGQGGAAAVADETSPPPDDGGSAGSTSVSCGGSFQWLLYTKADWASLASHPPFQDIDATPELLYVDAGCSYWVADTAAGEEVRAGVLNAKEAEQLWNDLGYDARDAPVVPEGTLSLGTVRLLRDATGQLTCLGDCSSPNVDARVQEIFVLASEWVHRLYSQSEGFSGDLTTIDAPGFELPSVPDS